MMKTYCQDHGYIQIIIMEICMVKTYCQGQGCIQIIIMETYGKDKLPSPRVVVDHHRDMVKT